MEAALAAVLEDFRVCAARATERLQAAAADELAAAQDQLASQEEALTRRERNVSEREEALRRKEQEVLKLRSSFGKPQELAAGSELCFHADLPTPTRASAATSAPAAASLETRRASQPAQLQASPRDSDSTNAPASSAPMTQILADCPIGSTSALRDVFEQKALQTVRRNSGEPQQQQQQQQQQQLSARTARASDERGASQLTVRTARASDEWVQRTNSNRVGTPIKARPVGEDACMPGENCRMSFRSQEGPLRRSNSGAGLTTNQPQQPAQVPMMPGSTPSPTNTSPKRQRPPLSPTKKKQPDASPTAMLEAKESARREAPARPAAAAAAAAASAVQDKPLLQPSPFRSLAQLLEMDKERCAAP
eukprot:TRINITY_DN3005_c0_g2_i1.p1 TRINITY_DN3005_c0_g2~~TRINITY_DN3005_c0_g2_i1.p1  ORF type:complete len:401 (-),score=96.25 TRINITY_DN3005_c0_g2_i1:88-1182(-)